MKRTTLHPRTLAEAEAIATGFLAARRVKHGHLTMTAGTDEGAAGGSAGDESGTGGGNGGDGGQGQAGGQPADQPGQQHGADGSGQGDLGFPANTPVAEMTADQRANYWRNQAKVQQARVPKDVDQLTEKASKWDEMQRSQMTASEQQLADAKAAGRAEALQSSNSEQVSNLLHVALSARGKSGDDLDELVAAANPAAFIADGKVVPSKITAYAARISGGTGGGGGTGGSGADLGQGRRGGAAKASVASGRSLFEERNAKKATANT